jgi:hypothetical protein
VLRRRMKSARYWRLALLTTSLVACNDAIDDEDDVPQPDDYAAFAPTPGKPFFQRGCGTPVPSAEQLQQEAIDLGRNQKPGAGGTVTINTYVHVIHDGGVGKVTQAQVDAQIAALNQGYSAFGFQFVLAGIDFTDNHNWYEAKSEKQWKAALRQGTGDDLNLYTNEGKGLLGWSYFPSGYAKQPVLDGVVVAWGTLPGANQPGVSDIPGYDYNEGDTATHEIGHWLGLYHTFQSGCSGDGDFVTDTNKEQGPNYDCTPLSTCNDGADPIHNFMDYGDDVCLTEFTAGQTARMQSQWATYRAGK